MDYKYLDINVHYVVEGKGEPIIFLHGWGANLHTFDAIVPSLINHYTVYRIDLPGFGKSDEMSRAFCLEDYRDFLETFIEKNKIENPILFGHSFGGKIIIAYCIKSDNYKKVILVSSSGVKRPLSISKRLNVWWFKIKKRWYLIRKDSVGFQNLYENAGSTDYQNASMVMKATLSKIVAKGLQKDLYKIKKEVLLIWGKLDKTTPYKDALLLNERIRASGLVTFDEAGHFPYLEDRNRFIKVLESYLELKG